MIPVQSGDYGVVQKDKEAHMSDWKEVRTSTVTGGTDEVTHDDDKPRNGDYE